MTHEQRTNELGNKKIGSLIFKMSIPAIISMLVQALYNIVDTMFVGIFTEGDAGLNALSLVFPLQMLLMAFALGVGIGACSLISRKLGEHKFEDAKNVYKTGFIMAVICGVLFLVLSTFLPSLFMSLFTDNPEVYTMGKDYLFIIMVCSLPIMIEQVSSKSLQGSGNMKVPMISQLVGAIVNICLDPIFIIKLGVSGAAIATVIAQACAMIVSFGFILRKKSIFELHYHNFKFEKSIIKGILIVAIPTMIMNSITSVTTFSMNFFLTKVLHQALAVTVLGVYFKLQSFVFMPIFGLNQGTTPILGYNYSANNKKRFTDTFKISLITSFSITLVCLVIFQIIPGSLLRIFNPSDETVNMGITALRIISPHFLLAAIGITISNVFTAIGHGNKSMIMSVLRQVIVILPSAFLLGYFIGIDAFWFCYIISEAVSVIIFLPICLLTIKKIFHKKNETFIEQGLIK